MGGKTDLTTVNLNLSGAYRLNSNWSFGLGFDAVYAKAKIERYAGDLGQIVAGSGKLPPALAGRVSQIPADTQIAHLNGNEWGFGWNAGILYELDKTTATVSPTAPKLKLTLMATIRAIYRPRITRSSATSVYRPVPMAVPLMAR